MLLGLSVVPALAATSTITVMVVDADTGQPISNVCVSAFSATYPGPGPVSACSYPDGHLALGVDSAYEYTLYANGSGDYPATYYGGADSSSATHVAAPSTVTFPQSRGVRPSGMLTLPGGAPAAGYHVYLSPTAGSLGGNAYTDANGRWQVTAAIPAGTYTAQFSDSTGASSWAYAQRTQATATKITFTLGQANVVDDTFLAPPRGTLSGKVVDADTKAPIANDCVQFRTIGPFGFYDRRACTDASGTFVLQNVPTGSVALRYADDSGTYPVRFSGGSYRDARATAVTVTDGQTTTVPTMRLTKGAVLTGIILNPDGTPAVSAFARPYFGRSSTLVDLQNGGMTDDHGEWAISGLPARTVTVGANKSGNPFDRGDTIETFAPGVEKHRDAALFTLAFGKTTDAGTVKLIVGGAVTGVVRDQRTGAPLSGVTVTLDGISDARAGGGEDPLEATTDATGVYTVRGVPSGGYSPLAFDVYGTYGSRWLGGVSDPGAARKVRVQLGVTATADFALSSAVPVTGTITRGGQPLVTNAADVFAYSVPTGREIGTNGGIDHGHFSLDGLAAGTYKLALREFDGTSDRTTWYGGTDFASATPVTVGPTGAVVTWDLP